jgi:hypothetical protein
MAPLPATIEGAPDFDNLAGAYCTAWKGVAAWGTEAERLNADRQDGTAAAVEIRRGHLAAGLECCRALRAAAEGMRPRLAEAFNSANTRIQTTPAGQLPPVAHTHLRVADTAYTQVQGLTDSRVANAERLLREALGRLPQTPPTP